MDMASPYRGSLYTGPLPPYARKANRRRVVEVLCRGQCSQMRWAEMNVNYPGEKALKKAYKEGRFFEFTATCLYCGYPARDPYKWSRPSKHAEKGRKR